MVMKQYDIVIRMKFTGDTVPAELVQEMLDDIEAAVYKSETNDIKKLFNDSNSFQIPQVIKDASLYRLDYHRGNALIVESTKKGSLIVEAVVAGLSYWVLQNTIGETFKDAWKETELHQKIRRFFLSDRVKGDSNKAKDIESNISNSVRRQYRRNELEATVSTHITYEESTVINVTVDQKNFIKLPPRFSELIDKPNGHDDSSNRNDG